MAKRKRQDGCATTERRLNEGRGNGRGKDYKPWLRVQDVPSQGLASRVPGAPPAGNIICSAIWNTIVFSSSTGMSL